MGEQLLQHAAYQLIAPEKEGAVIDPERVQSAKWTATVIRRHRSTQCQVAKRTLHSFATEHFQLMQS